MAHEFKIGRARRLPNIICDCADLTAPDGHLYTQDEIDVTKINSPDGSIANIDWDKERQNKFRKDVWQSIRSTGIGGSESAVLLGLSHWRTKLDLYYDKIGQLPLDTAKEPDNAKQYLFDFGHKMEEFIAEQFAKRLFWDKYKEIFEVAFSEKYGEIITITDVQCVRDTHMYRCPEAPVLLADFDFLVRFTLEDGRTLEGIFECKTSSPFQIKEKWEDGFPEHYNVQTNQYMLIGDYDFFVICCAADNSYSNFYAHLGFRDEEMDKKIIATAQEFWYNCVVLKKPPVSVNEDVQPALLTYEPVTDPTVADFTKFPYVQEQLRLYLEKKAEISALNAETKRLDEEAEVFKSNIAKLLNGRQKAVLCTADGAQYDFVRKVTSRTTFDARKRAAFLKDHPEIEPIMAPYFNVSQSEAFNIAKKKMVSSKANANAKKGA